MTEFKPIKEGKVREIYDNGDSLIMVATDRISAFDDPSSYLYLGYRMRFFRGYTCRAAKA